MARGFAIGPGWLPNGKFPRDSYAIQWWREHSRYALAEYEKYDGYQRVSHCLWGWNYGISTSLPLLPDRVSPTSVNGYPLNPSYAISINTDKIMVYQLQ